MKKYYRIVKFRPPDAYRDLTFNPQDMVVSASRRELTIAAERRYPDAKFPIYEGNVYTEVPAPDRPDYFFRDNFVIAMEAEEIDAEQFRVLLKKLIDYDMD